LLGFIKAKASTHFRTFAFHASSVSVDKLTLNGAINLSAEALDRDFRLFRGQEPPTDYRALSANDEAEDCRIQPMHAVYI
jgi:hypothetical protein